MERREGMSQILQPPQGVLLSTSGSRARGGLHCAEPLQEVTGSTGCSPFTPGFPGLGTVGWRLYGFTVLNQNVLN